MRERREKKVILCFRISGSVWNRNSSPDSRESQVGNDSDWTGSRESRACMMEIAYGVYVEAVGESQ